MKPSPVGERISSTIADAFWAGSANPAGSTQHGGVAAKTNTRTLEVTAGNRPTQAKRLVTERAEQHQPELVQSCRRARNRNLPHDIGLRTEVPGTLRATEMAQVGRYTLRTIVNDGTPKRESLRPLFWRKGFEPLRGPDRFSEMYLDEKMSAVACPDGADLAPEALHERGSEEASCLALHAGLSAAHRYNLFLAEEAGPPDQCIQ